MLNTGRKKDGLMVSVPGNRDRRRLGFGCMRLPMQDVVVEFEKQSAYFLSPLICVRGSGMLYLSQKENKGRRIKR